MTPKFKVIQNGEAFNSETSELISEYRDEHNSKIKYLYKSQHGALYAYTIEKEKEYEIEPMDEPAEICEFLEAAHMDNGPLFAEMFARIPEFGSETKRILTDVSPQEYKIIEDSATKLGMAVWMYIDKLLVEGRLSV
jgi:hypothetical protein